MTPKSVQSADWLIEKLDFGLTLGSWIPTGFERYVRILHPVYVSVREDGMEVARKPLPWNTLSEWNGKPITATSHILDILFNVDGRGWSENNEGGHAPLQGELDPAPLGTLLTHLVKETTAPDEIWMLTWTGFGGSPDTIGLPVVISEQLTGSGRKYVLRRGAIVTSENGRENSNFEGPASFWWPDDRSWFASSDIDASSTYIGGSKKLIEKILNDPALEVFLADLNDPYDGLYVSKTPINPIKSRVSRGELFRQNLYRFLFRLRFRLRRKPSSSTILYRKKRFWEWWLKP